MSKSEGYSYNLINVYLTVVVQLKTLNWLTFGAEEKGSTSQPRKLKVYGSREDIMASVFHIAISWQGFAWGVFWLSISHLYGVTYVPERIVFEKPSWTLVFELQRLDWCLGR
jgi:hypothetical protein